MSMLLLLVMLMMVAPGATRSYTGCTAVTTDKETTVVCHFEEDITQSSRGFNVRYFPGHRYDPSYEVVLMCNRRTSGGLVCRNSSDVNFDVHQVITDRLVLTRSASKDKEGGDYLCQAVPPLPGPIQFCTLTYIGTPTQPTPSPTTPPTTEKCEDTIVPIIVTVSVACLVIVIVVIVRLVIYWKRKRQWCIEHSKKRDVEDPAKPVPQDRPATSNPQEQPDHTGDRPGQQGVKQQQENSTQQGKKPGWYRQLLNKWKKSEAEPAAEAVEAEGATVAEPLMTTDRSGQQGVKQQQENSTQQGKKPGWYRKLLNAQREKVEQERAMEEKEEKKRKPID